MKQVVSLALSAVVITALTLRESHQEGSQFILEFEHASRENITQDSNQFLVKVGLKQIQHFRPTDYNVHLTKLKVRLDQGPNYINFIGEGKSDGYGQQIDNIRLYKEEAPNFNLIQNPGFENVKGNIIRTFSILPSISQVPYWHENNGQIQIGLSNVYNKNWPAKNHYVCELDAKKNSIVYQQVNLGKGFKYQYSNI